MLTIENINNKKIAIKGVGKMFYQEGFPVSISVNQLKKQGIEVSILHVADECIKNGWSGKTTYNKLVADFSDDIEGNHFDRELLRQFCFSNYDIQRKMIFEYLFESETIAKGWLSEKLQK